MVILLSFNICYGQMFSPIMKGVGHSSALTYATWNSTYSGGSWTLSGGNDVAQISGSNQMIIATIGASGGITTTGYWEITMTASSGNRDMGVINTLSPSTFVTWVGNQTSTQSWAIYSTTGGFTGALFNGGSITNNYFSGDFVQGDVLDFDVNVSAHTLKIYKNGSQLTPTVTISGSTIYPAISSNSATYTANFGATSFTYNLASGNACVCQ